MVTLRIVGRADQVDLAKAETLAHYLSKNLENFTFEILQIHPDEWSGYVEKLYIERRWHERCAHDRQVKKCAQLGGCAIYRDSGELLGGTQDFVNFVQKSYGFQLTYDSALLKEIAAENMGNLFQSRA